MSVERLAHAVRADDGQAVAGQQHLGPSVSHPAQGAAHSRGVALDLLGVAGVGLAQMNRSPQHSTRARGSQVHGVVVGLALSWRSSSVVAADLEVALGRVGLVGVAVLRRPDEVLDAELAPVDDRVVARGAPVAVEARGQVLVGDDVRRRPSRRLVASSSKTPTPKTWSMWPWLKTAVWRRCGDHAADLFVDERRDDRGAGVDHEQTVAGRHRRGVREARQEREPVGHLGQAAHVTDRVQLGGRDLAAPEAVRSAEDVVHGAAGERRSGGWLVGGVGPLGRRLCRRVGGLVGLALLDALFELGLRRAQPSRDLRDLGLPKTSSATTTTMRITSVLAISATCMAPPRADCPVGESTPLRSDAAPQPASATPRITARIDANPAIDPHAARPPTGRRAPVEPRGDARRARRRRS